VRVGDAGNEGAVLGADVNLHLDQLPGVRHTLGGEHLGDAKLDFHELVDRDAIACRLSRWRGLCGRGGYGLRRSSRIVGRFHRGLLNIILWRAGPHPRALTDLGLERRLSPSGVAEGRDASARVRFLYSARGPTPARNGRGRRARGQTVAFGSGPEGSFLKEDAFAVGTPTAVAVEI